MRRKAKGDVKNALQRTKRKTNIGRNQYSMMVFHYNHHNVHPAPFILINNPVDH